MKKQIRYVIGIDPDLHKSGYAVYSVDDKKLTECNSYCIWDIFSMLEEFLLHVDPCDYIVRLEYPSNTNTWHKGGKGAAVNVGKNQAVAIILKEFLEAKGFQFELLKPQGFSEMFKDDKFFRLQTGWSERTNQDARAAAAMCWGF